jgi:hypothetical protein
MKKQKQTIRENDKTAKADKGKMHLQFPAAKRIKVTRGT